MIAKKNQVPIQQPMYVNGMLHQSWISFFEKLGIVADETGVYILSEMSESIQNQASELIDVQTSIQDLRDVILNLQDTVASLELQINNLNNRVTALEDAP